MIKRMTWSKHYHSLWTRNRLCQFSTTIICHLHLSLTTRKRLTTWQGAKRIQFNMLWIVATWWIIMRWTLLGQIVPFLQLISYQIERDQQKWMEVWNHLLKILILIQQLLHASFWTNTSQSLKIFLKEILFLSCPLPMINRVRKKNLEVFLPWRNRLHASV